MPKLYIMRGVPGSGKSTYISKYLQDIKVHSTDNVVANYLAPLLFNKSGVEGYTYFFEYMNKNLKFSLLSLAHKTNQIEAEISMDNGLDIIIDNTNLTPREIKHYVEYGHKLNYDIEIINIPLENTAKELAKRNVHGVPIHVIEKMINKYNTYPQLTVEEILFDETSNKDN